MLRPMGKRPHGVPATVGFIVLGMLYSGLSLIVLAGLLSWGLDVLVPFSLSGGTTEFMGGLAYLVVLSLGLPFFLLINTRAAPRLRWATWWLLMVDAMLRVVFGLAHALGMSMNYRWGASSFWLYNFGAHRWSWVLASMVTAACTLAVLAYFSLRESPAVIHSPERDPSASLT